MDGAILPHNQRASAVWSAGGQDYDAISRSIGDALEHAVQRLHASAGQHVLDLATGTGWTSRPQIAADELARICKPGGRLALTTWLPDSAVVKMFGIMRPYMPPPPPPAPPSPFEWGRRDRLQELLGAHFDLKFEEGVNFQREVDGETAWKQASTSYGPTKMLATHLEPVQREALKKDFIVFIEGFRTELGITVPRGYLVTIGTRR